MSIDAFDIEPAIDSPDPATVREDGVISPERWDLLRRGSGSVARRELVGNVFGAADDDSPLPADEVFFPDVFAEDDGSISIGFRMLPGNVTDFSRVVSLIGCVAMCLL